MLHKGYSKATIGKNIKKATAEGKSPKQAVAMALSSAQKSAEKAGKPAKGPGKPKKGKKKAKKGS